MTPQKNTPTSRDRPAREVPVMGEFTPHATDIDHGTRCSNHVGEVFPPRCEACDQAGAEAAADPGLSNVETPLVAWMIHHLDRANGDIHLAIVYMQADLKKRGTR